MTYGQFPESPPSSEFNDGEKIDGLAWHQLETAFQGSIPGFGEVDGRAYRKDIVESMYNSMSQ
jgi:hypothetical protein